MNTEKLNVVEIHISDLMRLMANMDGGDSAKANNHEGSDWYFITKIVLPVGNLDPIFVINYFGPVSPSPTTAPHAFYPTPFLLKAALTARGILRKNGMLYVSEYDYRRLN